MKMVRVWNQIRKVNEFILDDEDVRRMARAIVHKAGYTNVKEDFNSVCGLSFNGREQFRVSWIDLVDEDEDEKDGLLPGDLEEA